jgi:diaminohydroxyphosphoribosylaminopyrimidine deaminase/5-amino-6-(5-phosphoribosylamino)uracil reductase
MVSWLSMKNIPILSDKIISELEKSLGKLAQTKYRRTGLPFVTLKIAQTLDGKIATLTGDSRWISSPSSLRFAHRMRSWHDAILVGVDTIIRDDPQLTIRLIKGKNPKKIIVDSRLRTPINSNILRGKAALSTVIATTSLCDKGRIKRYKSKGVEVWLVKKDRSNQVDLQNLLQKLGQRNIGSVLVEGGSKIISSFLKKQADGSIGLADHLVVVIAPKIVGSGITYLPANRFEHSLSFSHPKFFRSGDDIIAQAFIKE